MNKAVMFTVADSNNMKYANMMINSFKKFHPDVPVVIFGEKELIKTKDKEIFYKASPYFAKQLMKDYDLVLKMDADQIVTGNLDHILHDESYDVGTVFNINRVDPPQYGYVQGWGIPPNEYYNCGLVAMRSKKFITKWLDLCQSKYFYRFQFREQDLLNILCHYNDYKVKCFDHTDKVNNVYNWNGLVSKGEWHSAVMKGEDMVVPRGNDNYPDHDMVLKVIHWAGGNMGEKMEYRKYFSEECIRRLDYLVTQ